MSEPQTAYYSKDYAKFLADVIWRQLNMHMADDRTITAATVTHWLEYHGAGSPDVPLMRERVRDDAQLWSTAASVPELEAYVAAGVIALEKNMGLTDNAAKRLAALGWQNMQPDSRARFKAWIEKEEDTKNG